MGAEFLRNVRVELTPHRLVGIPAVLGAAQYLAFLLNGSRLDGDVAGVALWGLGLLALVWGTRSVADSVIAEVNARTWDGQRMSALGAWSMTWGKLAGSAVHVWFACAVCAVVFLAAAIDEAPWALVWRRLALVVGAAVLAHAVALALSLHAVRRRADGPPARGLLHFVLGLLAAMPFLVLGRDALGEFGSGARVVWWGTAVPAHDFVLGSLAAWGAWAVAGAWRVMRAELQLRTAPWPWLGFIAFAMAWAAGFVTTDVALGPVRLGGDALPVPALRLLAAHAAALAIAYVMLFVEPKDPVTWRRLRACLRAGRVVRALEIVPRWSIAALLAACAAAGVVLAGLDLGAMRGPRVEAVAAASIAFLARDAGLVVLLNLGPRRRRADTAAFVYLLVAYLVGPALAGALGLSWLRPFLVPGGTSGLVPATLAPAAEAALVWAFAWQRWRRGYGRAEEAR